jgi:hypothetical protein
MPLLAFLKKVYSLSWRDALDQADFTRLNLRLMGALLLLCILSVGAVIGLDALTPAPRSPDDLFRIIPYVVVGIPFIPYGLWTVWNLTKINVCRLRHFGLGTRLIILCILATTGLSFVLGFMNDSPLYTVLDIFNAAASALFTYYTFFEPGLAGKEKKPFLAHQPQRMEKTLLFTQETLVWVSILTTFIAFFA